MEPQTTITLHPRFFCIRLLLTSVLLLLLNLIAIYLKMVLKQNNFGSNALYFFFDASSESNIPTLFSTLILFTAAILLFVIYATKAKQKSSKIHWLILGIIFSWLTVDEAATIHEQFNKFSSFKNDASGYLHYGWVAPYAGFALLSGFFFSKFLFSLPIRTRWLFVLSGFVYVGAALGFELIEGRMITLYGANNIHDKLFCAFEEFLEMAGIVLFIYALMDYLSALKPRVTVSR